MLPPSGGFSFVISGEVDMDLTPESRLLRPPPVVVVVSADDASPITTLRGDERVRWRVAALC